MRVVTASQEILQPRPSTEYQPTQLQKGPIDRKLMDFGRSEQTDTSEIKVNHISGTRKKGNLEDLGHQQQQQQANREASTATDWRSVKRTNTGHDGHG